MSVRTEFERRASMERRGLSFRDLLAGMCRAGARMDKAEKQSVPPAMKARMARTYVDYRRLVMRFAFSGKGVA